MLEHEDNEMMRPYIITQTIEPAIPDAPLITIAVLIIVLIIGVIGLKALRSRSRKK